MRFFLVPGYAFSHVTDISAAFLTRLGIKFLMLDLDNTLTPYREKQMPEEISRWAAALRDGGITLYIVSNSKRPGRVEQFAGELGISYIKSAYKPLPRGVTRAMRNAGYSRGESALIGDQVYTDAIAANLAGARSILVRPLSIKHPALALRYALEVPFRALCRNKMWRQNNE